MTTTYINRCNTNRKVFEEANRIKKEEGSKKPVIPFAEAYRKQRQQMLAKIITQPGSILHKMTFQTHRDPTRRMDRRTPINRRVGKPKYTWMNETTREMWDTIRTERPEFLSSRTLNRADPRHIEAMEEKSKDILIEREKKRRRR